MAPRVEFSTKTREQAFERACGRCEWVEDGIRCDAVLSPGNVDYDHIICFAISRDSTLANAQALCKAHHAIKTARDDIPLIAKTRRQHQNHIGASRPAGTLRSRGFAKPAEKDRTSTKSIPRRPMYVGTN
jgi:5-methylcytosine-specific restriction protein A